MIVKVQTEHGWEWIDKVRRVSTGPTLRGTTNDMPMRHINTSAALGDHGPYQEVILSFEDCTMEVFETNGQVVLLNDNGKTADRI